MVFAFVGAPPSGRWVVVCKAYRDEGVAPTGSTPCVLWEPTAVEPDQYRHDAFLSPQTMNSGFNTGRSVP
jgi:hypothetical protein